MRSKANTPASKLWLHKEKKQQLACIQITMITKDKLRPLLTMQSVTTLRVVINQLSNKKNISYDLIDNPLQIKPFYSEEQKSNQSLQWSLTINKKSGEK